VRWCSTPRFTSSHDPAKRAAIVLQASRGRVGPDEQKPAADGTVEAWVRSPENPNPIGGRYGMKKGLRGRLGNYVPPILETLGLAELEHNARNNRMRAH
jgi:hypothetical protein